jgi:hypothetical protein
LELNVLTDYSDGYAIASYTGGPNRGISYYSTPGTVNWSRLGIAFARGSE